jgi:hypothetical protein
MRSLFCSCQQTMFWNLDILTTLRMENGDHVPSNLTVVVVNVETFRALCQNNILTFAGRGRYHGPIFRALKDANRRNMRRNPRIGAGWLTVCCKRRWE